MFREEGFAFEFELVAWIGMLLSRQASVVAMSTAFLTAGVAVLVTSERQT